MSFIRKIRKGDRIYLAEVESQRIGGKVIQRHIRYVGKEADGKTILSASISDVTVDQVKLHGPLLVLHHLAQGIHLPSLLGEYGNEILSLVYAHCVDYQSINQMSRWFERTDLNMMLDLDELTEARLLAALDSLESQDAALLQRRIFERVKATYDVDEKGIVYDVTNTYLYGRKCPLGKLGHDKEAVKGRPLIQIGLATTQKEGVPLFHKVFEGNIHDARTLQDCLTEFRRYGIREGLLVFDRGIGSEKNYKDIKDLSWEVLCGLPIRGHLPHVLRRAIRKKAFLQYQHRVRLHRSVFYVVAQSHTIAGIRGKLALCFNERLGREIKESRYDEIAQAQTLLKHHKAIKPGLEQFLDHNGQLLVRPLRNVEALDGYSCVFTTAALSKEEMVRMYFDKDLIEKAFQSLKGVVRLRPLRHWLYNRVVAHVFICYLSYLLLTLLKIKLKKTGISPVEALRELDSLYKVYMRDSRKGFRVSRVVALNKKQEAIVKAVDKKLLKLV